MPSKPNNIIPLNDKLYNYLNNANYGMSKPQFHNMNTIVNGLI